MSGPRADWTRVGSQYYRKVQLYVDIFDDEFELENYIVVGAPFGGALALYRDEKKAIPYKTGASQLANIDIYSCSGQLIQRINWDKSSIRGLGWSGDETLIAVSQDGTVKCYYGFAGDFNQFSLGNDAEDVGVKACKFWSTGFVALLSDNSLIEVSNLAEPRPRLLARPPSSEIHSWAIVPPSYTLSRAVEVLVSVERTIHVVDATQSEDRGLQHGPFTFMQVSPDGKLVLLSTEDGLVWVITSDFQTKITEYTPSLDGVPLDIQWCGNDAIVLASTDEIHLVEVGTSASPSPSAKFFYESRVHLTPELDGIRLTAQESCDFLQKVPAVTESIFKLGSTAPSAILLDAVDQLQKGSPKADDNIQLIKPQLAEAVDACVNAAGYEFSLHWQRELLRAASFGKSVLDLFNSDDFVDMCEILRVLNAIRHHEIGLAVSFDQYVRLGPEGLVNRLVNRNEHQLAIGISEYLRLSLDSIYVHWACQKVRRSLDDEASITRVINEKLSGKRGISYETIARTAYDEGRANLATRLLNYEPRTERQVPLLLSMEEDETALDKAIESGDTDLIQYVLVQLRRKLPVARFFNLINTRPVAISIVETTAKQQDSGLLRDMYYQDDRRIDSANLALKESLSSGLTSVSSRIDKLKLAGKLIEGGKDASTYSKALDEWQKLLKLQESCEAELTSLDTEGYVGLTLNATLFKLIKMGYGSRAKKLASDFKISDKTIWWTRLQALIQKRDWVELEEVAKVRKSPIGWEPFFNLTLSAGNPKLASVFIAKCTNLSPQSRAEMWVKCGQLVKAAEELVKAKDTKRLEKVRESASGQQAIEIDRLMAGLKGR